MTRRISTRQFSRKQGLPRELWAIKQSARRCVKRRGKGEPQMELRFQMNDILPLLPIPQPPIGRSSYNIPCPVCDHAGSRKRHLNINLKRNVFRCPKCGQFEGGVFDLYAYYTGVSRDKVRQDLMDRLGGGESHYSSKSGGKKKALPRPKPAEVPQAPLVGIETRDRVWGTLRKEVSPKNFC